VSKVRAYFELLRFPAVFTAISDVTMGYLVTFGALHPVGPFVLLVVASACMYLAGMVLNDVFDAPVDALERPDRPIPSQRIPIGRAKILGWSLLVFGLLTAAHLGYHGNSTRTTLVAVALATCIVAYDGGLKLTLPGPLVMGGCRMLNVLLGMSLATAADGVSSRPWTTTELLIAAGIGVYVTGITVFSRSEARIGNRRQLAAGIVVMQIGLLMLMISGRVELRPAHHFTEQDSWPLLWFALASVIAGRCLWAVWRLEPRATQVAVRNSLRALIFIDAALVAGFCSPEWGWWILSLLVPMLLLERWASTT
jgi:4-hydroxybenzoate polyprenyltransferase